MNIATTIRAESDTGEKRMSEASRGVGPRPAALVLGSLTLLLAIGLIVLIVLNGQLQSQAATGQRRIAQAQAAANVNNTLIRLLARSAVEDHDAAIQSLLAQNGITLQQQAAAPAAAPAAATGK